MWIRQCDDTKMPKYLSEALSETCPYCGSHMMNYYNDQDGRCTNRRCENFYCPGMIAARADNMRQILGIKGLGFAACLRDIRENGIKRPIELLPVWGIRPKVSIGTYLRLQCWEGVDSGLDTEMKKYNITSLDELFERYDGKYRFIIDKNKDDLYKYAELVELPTNVKKAPPKRTYTIMITGSPRGFKSKEHFIEEINDACQGKIVTIHQATKRQSGVDFLIRDSGSTTGKVNTAIKAGIPIVTSTQYMEFLAKEISTL